MGRPTGEFDQILGRPDRGNLRYRSQLHAGLGLKIDIAAYAMPMLVFGVIMIFQKNNTKLQKGAAKMENPAIEDLGLDPSSMTGQQVVHLFDGVRLNENELANAVLSSIPVELVVLGG